MVSVEGRLGDLLSVTSTRSLSETERSEWFALPPLMEAGAVIDGVDGPWPAIVEECDVVSPLFVRAFLRGDDDQRYALRLAVEADPPHRIRYASRWHAPDGVTTRPAQRSDAQELAALERRTPVVDGDVRRTYDRGGGWFDQIDLMDDATVVVAEAEGRLIGVHVDAVHTVPIGTERRLLYRMRTRVDPSMQGRSVFPALNGAAVDQRLPFVSSGWGFDSEETLVALGNERMRAVAAKRRSTLSEWSVPVERTTIDTARASTHGPVRFASRDDVDELHELFVAARGREVGFPYRSAADVQARFERAPNVYGWERVFRAEHAALGVGRDRVTIISDSPGGQDVRTCAIALDYGCRAGHEAELVDLVGAACSALRADGVTHLLVTTSAASPLRDTLRALATEVSTFGRRLRIDEPVDTPARGVYIDPIYF